MMLSMIETCGSIQILKVLNYTRDLLGNLLVG